MHLADGSAIKSGQAPQETVPLSTTIANNHQELLCLDVIASPVSHYLWHALVTGPIPTRQLGHRGNQFPFFLLSSTLFTGSYLCSTAPPSLLCLDSDSETCQSVPAVYHSLLDMFSKKGAETLPPHRPFDCPIDLLPRAKVPF